MERSIGRSYAAAGSALVAGCERGEELADALRRAARDLAGDAPVAQEHDAIGDRGRRRRRA